MRFKAIDKTWSTKENLVPKVLLVTIRHAEYVWMTSTDSDIHALLYGNPKYSCAGKKRFKNRKNLESFVKQFFPYIKEGLARFEKSGYKNETFFDTDECPHCGLIRL